MRRIVLLLMLLLVPFRLALAQTGGPPTGTLTVALLPLDSRPATATLPLDIAAVGGVRVIAPPLEALGTATRAADHAELERWLAQTTADALVVSLDALAYGGLVQSRSSDLDVDSAWARLEPVRAWRARTDKPVYAFITIPRAPDAVDRARNLALIHRAVDWAETGVIARLAVTWDDALPGSPAPGEGAALRDEVTARGLGNVAVYPGADEAASTLISHFVLHHFERQYRLRLEFSDPARKDQTVIYDGQPLETSARMQAEAAGLEIVTGPADLTLFIYNGGDMRGAALRLSALARRGPVALVDVFEVNKAASRLVDDTVTLQRFMKLYAFAAWGTPGNNLGSALAQAAMRLIGGPSLEASRLLLRAYVNDYLYSSLVRPQIRERYGDLPLDTEQARAELLERLRAVFRPARLASGLCLGIENAEFPWARSFEVRLEVSVSEPVNANCPEAV